MDKIELEQDLITYGVVINQGNIFTSLFEEILK